MTLAPIAQGKVRDIYDAGPGLVALVASDRISAYDVVMPTLVPDKGRVLTGLSLHWFARLADVVPGHLVDAPAPDALRTPQNAGRLMVAKRLRMFPVECVARGYLSGSAWREYRETGTVADHALPAGLTESARLPEPIFTPATKSSDGHDENITRARAAEIVGADAARDLEALTLELYRRAERDCARAGLILADTKFEFGRDDDGTITLGDEVLTPDSSRLWPGLHWKPGGPVPSFDKQYVRDWLESSGWNKQPPAPQLPAEVAERTAAKYREALQRLTGTDID